jgi:iron complex transport system substrate-binding protein
MRQCRRIAVEASRPARKHSRALTALAVAVTLMAAGCAAGGAPTTVAGSGTGEAMVVTDALGRKTAFTSPPMRITVAGRATFMIADALYLFPEAAGRLVAVESLNQSAASFLPVLDPRFGDITILGRNAGAEQIAATDPDVVILKTAMAADLGPTLEQLGIPVVYVDLENPEQFARDIGVLGEVLGDSERVAVILAFYQLRLDAIDASLASLSPSRPSVLLVRYNDQQGTTTFEVPPADWLQTTMVELAGGSPVWTDASGAGGWAVVGFEQIAAWDPDQIYVVDYAGGSDEVIDRLRVDPAWQQLAAVAGGKIYGFPGDFFSWDQPDPRWILGLSWLFTKVQAGLAIGVDIEAEMRAFFSEMYGMSAAAVESDIIPVLFGTLP